MQIHVFLYKICYNQSAGSDQAEYCMEVVEPEIDKLGDIEDDYRKLSYEYLTLFKWTTDGKVFDQIDLERINYKVSLTDGLKSIPSGFYLLEKASPESNQKREPVQSKSKTHMLKKNKGEGYKIHMSIYDQNDDNKNLLIAWDIVSRASIKHNMTFIKIVKHEERENCRKSSQCGKEITWYKIHNEVDAEAIQAYLTDITKGFVNQNIIPGAQTILKNSGGKLEPTIKGSNYFSYRTDDPNDTDNPFKDIVINVADQPDRKTQSQDRTNEHSTYNMLLTHLDTGERDHDPSSVLKGGLEVDNDSGNVRELSKEQILKRITVNDEENNSDPIDKDGSDDDSDNSSGCCPC